MTLLDKFKIGTLSAFTLFLMVNIPVYALQAKITEMPNNQTAGNIAIKQTEKSEFVKAKVNDIIFENGVIVTGKGSGSQVELEVEEKASRALVRLGSNSYLKLNTSSNQLKLLLQEGKILVQNVDNLNLNVYVGNFVAASEGTTFSVALSDISEVNEEEDELDVDLEVYEGKVRFSKEGEEIDKAEYILPGEKVNLKLRFKKLLEQRQTKIDHIQQLKQSGMFDESRLNKLNQFINATREKNLQLKEQRISDFKLNMSGPLFQGFKKQLAARNLERIKQNELLQQSGELLNRNKERRQKIIEQIKNNRIKRQEQWQNNQGNQKEDTQEQQAQINKPLVDKQRQRAKNRREKVQELIQKRNNK